MAPLEPEPPLEAEPPLEPYGPEDESPPPLDATQPSALFEKQLQYPPLQTQLKHGSLLGQQKSFSLVDDPDTPSHLRTHVSLAHLTPASSEEELEPLLELLEPEPELVLELKRLLPPFPFPLLELLLDDTSLTKESHVHSVQHSIAALLSGS